ncbi:quinone-dependent dihydroorotate dehydrogenase [Thioalkalivibrio paradoxus]|uniref:Dihydroorotate dehydrogenase (quinone) n=1 Tax=Thioalkalivibrio paradoxus ARh 1 TaxID=713585 RepID=W0DIE7_9GAMM|nr:quinone-dependent dihydroorotate dehydrogenase [Thioalkalivibrio paradoxus]AHE98404.1 dihydroorotate dehydrogenase [Thioalkalivibrio paradoxus ARh 1]
MYRLIRPLLFAMSPETAHRVSFAALDVAARLHLVPGGVLNANPVQVMGLEFPNRVGLAAGLDKNGEHIRGLARFGFGHLELGTVTPRAQPGNPRPRLYRLPQAQALINRMGFNNEGAERLVENVRAAGTHYPGILGINIGKNKTTPNERAADDYRSAFDTVYPWAGYVAVNISSPNTESLRELQQDAALDGLLGALKTQQARLSDRHGRYVPLALKIAPDLDEGAIEAIARLLVRHGIDGVIATNTTTDRSAVAGLPHADEAGGLSGAPVAAPSLRVIRTLSRTLDGAVPIIGVGGILSGQDAVDKIRAGASLVQIYTGLIYRGPGLVRECVQALAGEVN